MRKALPLLGLLSLVVLAPAACGSSDTSSSLGAGDDGGASSGSSSSGSSGGSSGSSGSGSGSGSGSSSGSSGGSSGSSGGSSGSSGSSSGGTTGSNIKNVFIVAMENNNWSAIQGNSEAKYINSLLTDPEASWCSQYYNPPGIHPSEPNYVWLEAATNQFADVTFSTDNPPSATNSTASAQHLATLMTAKNVSWRGYAEGISGSDCPVVDHTGSPNFYVARHVPFMFFQDVVGNPPSTTTAGCKAHMAPFSQLATDLTNNTVAQYNFITPNLCDDMHGATGCPSTPEITQGDTWLSNEIPKIRASQAYKNGGVIFITWDEGEGSDGPIGMIALSPFAKGNGHQSTIHYDHSSTVRTIEEIFGLTPFIGNAASPTVDLSDLFKVFP